ncbi:MAG TPA: PIN domain-containing protein [Geminicoccus sp.]|uniref:PIN domain-containing protein n=1 Tax=Geminicoccus sp. TaxID=2024832 RepID=UPI002CF7EE2C|nr:PIN domain-containing protein [Geminicoccus sp.]HWL67907.1 PIN domain-containing protein [Geminicoccus sp.]
MPGSFADSNVVLYALTIGSKAERAWEILRTRPTINVQVLHVLRLKQRLTWAEIEERMGLIRELLPERDLTVRVHDLGRAMAAHHGFRTYDAMIVAAALDAGCATLWSEDMQDGMVVVGQLTIRNPFQ